MWSQIFQWKGFWRSVCRFCVPHQIELFGSGIQGLLKPTEVDSCGKVLGLEAMVFTPYRWLRNPNWTLLCSFISAEYPDHWQTKYLLQLVRGVVPPLWMPCSCWCDNSSVTCFIRDSMGFEISEPSHFQVCNGACSDYYSFHLTLWNECL